MSLTLGPVARTEQRDGRINGRFDDVADGPAVLDGKRGQLPQPAQQDHGQRRGQLRQIGAPESRVGAQVDQQVGQQLQPAALDGARG